MATKDELSYEDWKESFRNLFSDEAGFEPGDSVITEKQLQESYNAGEAYDHLAHNLAAEYGEPDDEQE